MPELSEREQLQETQERCHTGAVALGICGAVFVIACLLMLPTLADDPSTGQVIWFPIGLAVACFVGAGGLFRHGQLAAATLSRLEAEERASRWRAAQSDKPEQTQGPSAEEQNRIRMREDERRVAEVRANYERGSLHTYQSPISLAPMEKCLYVCTCSGWDAKLHLQHVHNAQLVITSERLAVVEPDSAQVSPLGEILRFVAIDDHSVRLWLTNRPNAYDLSLDYPLETVAYLLIAFKTAGITPPRPVAK